MSGKFTIPFAIKKDVFIVPQDRFFLIGSCFTEHIGIYLANSGFITQTNPFGILYQPLAISNALKAVISNKQYGHQDLIENHEGRFVSFDHHGVFSGSDPDAVLLEINMAVAEAYMQLKSASVLIITLGTAWAYEYLPQQRWVANCHKIPQKYFSKHLLELDTIVNSLEQTIQSVQAFNPDLKIILTISPVKHLNDGVIENQQSKATLILACRHLVQKMKVHYFPAYEIVNDELRDYRFYASDLTHPNQQAIEYVWHRFVETYFSDSAHDKIKEGMHLGKLLNHRPMHGVVEPLSLHQKIEQFLNKYPK